MLFWLLGTKWKQQLVCKCPVPPIAGKQYSPFMHSLSSEQNALQQFILWPTNKSMLVLVHRLESRVRVHLQIVFRIINEALKKWFHLTQRNKGNYPVQVSCFLTFHLFFWYWYCVEQLIQLFPAWQSHDVQVCQLIRIWRPISEQFEDFYLKSSTLDPSRSAILKTETLWEWLLPPTLAMS